MLTINHWQRGLLALGAFLLLGRTIFEWEFPVVAFALAIALGTLALATPAAGQRAFFGVPKLSRRAWLAGAGVLVTALALLVANAAIEGSREEGQRLRDIAHCQKAKRVDVARRKEWRRAYGQSLAQCLNLPSEMPGELKIFDCESGAEMAANRAVPDAAPESSFIWFEQVCQT